MLVDAFTQVSADQAVTTDAYSTNTQDITTVRDIGAGEPVGFAVSVAVAADIATGDETYTFLVVQSANADLSSHDVLASYTRTAAQLGLGQNFFLPIPDEMVTKRYIGLRYDTGGTTPSITVSAHVTKAKDYAAKPEHYAKNYAV